MLCCCCRCYRCCVVVVVIVVETTSTRNNQWEDQGSHTDTNFNTTLLLWLVVVFTICRYAAAIHGIDVDCVVDVVLVSGDVLFSVACWCLVWWFLRLSFIRRAWTLAAGWHNNGHQATNSDWENTKNSEQQQQQNSATSSNRRITNLYVYTYIYIHIYICIDITMFIYLGVYKTMITNAAANTTNKHKSPIITTSTITTMASQTSSNTYDKVRAATIQIVQWKEPHAMLLMLLRLLSLLVLPCVLLLWLVVLFTVA